MAKQFLDSINKEYKEIDLEKKPEKAKEIMEISWMHTVPQIFDGKPSKSNLIGWYDDMIEKYKAGKIFQD